MTTMIEDKLIKNNVRTRKRPSRNRKVAFRYTYPYRLIVIMYNGNNVINCRGNEAFWQYTTS